MRLLGPQLDESWECCSVVANTLECRSGKTVVFNRPEELGSRDHLSLRVSLQPSDVAWRCGGTCLSTEYHTP